MGYREIMALSLSASLGMVVHYMSSIAADIAIIRPSLTTVQTDMGRVHTVPRQGKWCLLLVESDTQLVFTVD